MRSALLLLMASAAVLAAGCRPADTEFTQGGNESTEASPDAVYLSEEAIEVGCAIAANYITAEFDKADKPIVLKDATAYAPQLTEEDASFAIAHLLDGEKGDATDPANQARGRAMVTLMGRNLFAQCRAIADLKARRAFTPDPKKEAPPVTPDGLFYTYNTLAVSLPLVDLENGQAFMWIATGCGPLCGGSGIEMFTRQPDESWLRTDYMGLTVS